MTVKTKPDDSDEAIAEIERLGEALYEEKVRDLVEPDYVNHYAAIHVDSGDYAVGKSTVHALRAMDKIRPEASGRIYLRRIGDEPDYALIARIIAGEMRAKHKQ